MVDSSQTAPVAGLSGAAVGAFDFSGNVFGWVDDWYGQAPPAGVDVRGLALGFRRVFRGGCWSVVPYVARVAYRGNDASGDSSYDLGVRLLRTVP